MNNRNAVPVLFVTLMCVACSVKQQHNNESAKSTAPIQEAATACVTDTMKIDLHQSAVYWKGTKMRGAGKHEGELRFEHGFVLLCNEALAGGSCTVDMKTLKVTDIPATDPVPIKNLTGHLSNADFFDIEHYPNAFFTITAAKHEEDTIYVTGNLSIKDVMLPVTFTATHHAGTFITTFTINRKQWHAGYTGTWADRTLVDDEVTLRIVLAFQPKER